MKTVVKNAEGYGHVGLRRRRKGLNIGRDKRSRRIARIAFARLLDQFRD